MTDFDVPFPWRFRRMAGGGYEVYYLPDPANPPATAGGIRVGKLIRHTAAGARKRRDLLNERERQTLSHPAGTADPMKGDL